LGKFKVDQILGFTLGALFSLITFIIIGFMLDWQPNGVFVFVFVAMLILNIGMISAAISNNSNKKGNKENESK
jgi:glucose uptake protein GlcU